MKSGRNIFSYGSVIISPEEVSYFTKYCEIIETKAWADGDLFDTGKAFPVMSPGSGRVYGQLLWVDETAMPSLINLAKRFDAMNAPHVFELRPVKVFTENETYDAMTFMYASGKGLRKIPSGIWTLPE